MRDYQKFWKVEISRQRDKVESLKRAGYVPYDNNIGCTVMWRGRLDGQKVFLSVFKDGSVFPGIAVI